MKTSKKDIKALRHLLKDDSHSKHHLKIEITKNILPHIFDEEPKEEAFVIDKEFLKAICQEIELNQKSAINWIKEKYPSAFVKDKKELVLEVGKWYKRPHNKALFCIVGNTENEPFEVYGFDMGGNWMEPNKLKKVQTFRDDEVEAAPEEVKKALTKEAVKRGFGEGVWLKKQGSNKHMHQELKICGNFDWYPSSNILDDEHGNGHIFDNGIWSEIIPTITKEEAEKLLNKKII